ncbi:bacterial regulatory helix-turn-helix, lysR family protein [Collimonas fungivorans]|uniref:Bacterial regulatory helix-turn-helix, lysR family protein n=1 Tax=Collimonas fungivorans TaxID=158899 RepID=A0A127PH42_9BURK|nr:LysR family transcriptional regulator [Collimonas fungivorans]AMO97129.1 bacterial regulatory helix-turn-helix, lysR family protein [Collimonas fungivorans]
MSNAPTLEQLRTFIAVCESGSFSAAAIRLGRAQSVVSYTIANLESELGIAVFERSKRRPVLTPAGRAILADARRLDLLMSQLSANAAGMAQGLEAEIALVVDVMFPFQKLTAALQAFTHAFPTVALNLTMEALGGVLKLVMEGECCLGISGPNGNWPDVIETEALGGIQLVPVAAASHALAQRGQIRIAEAREHTQLVLSDRSRLTEGQSFGVYGARIWKLADLGAKHRLLLAGLGWGSMPLHLVANDLEAGTLVRLDLVDRFRSDYKMSLINRIDTPVGPALQWMKQHLKQEMA